MSTLGIWESCILCAQNIYLYVKYEWLQDVLVSKIVKPVGLKNTLINWVKFRHSLKRDVPDLN